jgi:hypothetical protein
MRCEVALGYSAREVIQSCIFNLMHLCWLSDAAPLAGGEAKMLDAKSLLEFVQALFIVLGFLFTIYSFNMARRKDAEARKLEAARPFLQLRQSLYTEALRAAATLANPTVHTDAEMQGARRRFRNLYVAELSMVEPPGVEHQMVELARQIDPELLKFTPATGCIRSGACSAGFVCVRMATAG